MPPFLTLRRKPFCPLVKQLHLRVSNSQSLVRRAVRYNGQRRAGRVIAGLALERGRPGGKSGHRSPWQKCRGWKSWARKRRRPKSSARSASDQGATRLVTPGDGHAGSAARQSYTFRCVAPGSARRGAAESRKVPQKIYRRRSSTVASRRKTCETSSIRLLR